ICDPDGNIVRANPALAAMTGYTEEELALPPEERFQLLDVRYTDGQPVPMDDTAPVQAAQQGKPCTTGPLVLFPGTERELHVLVSSVPLRDGLGHFRGLVTTSTNVTELQRAKQQVEREHALLKAVFETAPSALVVADAEGRITMTNRLAETLYPRRVPVGEALETRAELQLCHPDGSPYQSQDLPLSRSVLKGETSENVHMLIAGPGGQTRHLLANSAPIRDGSGRITGAVAVFSDWTQLADAIREQERLLAELNEHRDHLENLVSQRTAELAASEAKYRELVENASSVILKWDKDGILTFANEYAHELFRYPPGELAGREATVVLPRRDSHGHDLRHMKDAVSTSPEEWAYNEHESLTSDGRLLWMAWANRPIYGRDGELEGMMCVGTDRTAQHEAEQKLLAYQEQLRHLAAELALAEQRERQRISIRLHDEVAQPLGALKIHLCMLQSEHPSAMAQIGKLVAMTDDAIKQARTVLTELSPPVLQNLGLIEAVRWWAGLVEERQGLPVRVEAPEEPLHIGQAHEITLFQAIKELLQNVVKHAKATGAWVGFEYLPEQMKVTVGDDGEGFDAGSIHPSVSGGFGLFSIQERLSYLGGDMAIASTAGRGCTITLTLPNQA
ncbi:MAG: PAS domain S-box protein, partial [Armatimonadia bacterium]